MNAKQLFTASVFTAAFAFAGSAFAIGSDDAIHYQDVQSTKTRAEVQAELTQAYRNGELRRNEYTSNAQTEAVVSDDDAVRAANAPRMDEIYIGG